MWGYLRCLQEVLIFISFLSFTRGNVNSLLSLTVIGMDMPCNQLVSQKTQRQLTKVVGNNRCSVLQESLCVPCLHVL